MSRTLTLKLIVAVLVLVVVSVSAATVEASYQEPVSAGTSAIERYWLPYVVQANESLVDVAERFGIPAPVIAATNGISNFDTLTPGQVVWIPLLKSEEAAVTPATVAVAPAYVEATSPLALFARPAVEYGLAATMRAGETALVLGRSADGGWFLVASTSSVDGRGWVQAGSARFQMYALPVAPR